MRNSNSIKPFAKASIGSDKGSKRLPVDETILKGEIISFSFSKFVCKSFKSGEFNNMFFCVYDSLAFILLLIQKLTEFCKMNVFELKEGGKSTRCHPVNGDSLDLLKKILIQHNFSKQFIEQQEFYELTISRANCRFFGYFVNSVFYIVIIDPHHLMYKNQKFYSKNDIITKSFDPWKEIN